MAIAIFSDIHGNLEALEAIISHARKKNHIKEMYFLGDAITFGPDSSACLKLLEKHKVICVVGNHEQRVTRYDKAVKTMTYATHAHMQFIFSQLDREDLRFIKSMPVEHKINYKGINIFFTHYVHDKDGVIQDKYEEFTDSRLLKMFGHANCDVVFFGHVHTRYLTINEQGKSYLCAGASGCVKGDKTFYTVFDVQQEYGSPNYNIDRVNVPFNRRKFDEKMRNTPLPDKENYAIHTFGLDLKC